MGCGMARHSQGRGLMQEAASALAGFGFASLGVHRLYAETLARNRPAIRLCTSLGMRQEAHFREHRYFKGQWWDTAVFALLRSEWSLHHGDTASAARAASRSSHTPNGQADQPARPPQ